MIITFGSVELFFRVSKDKIVRLNLVSDAKDVSTRKSSLKEPDKWVICFHNAYI